MNDLLVTLGGGDGAPPIRAYGVAFALAVVSSLSLTHAVRGRARRARLFDGTDPRKLHEAEIPRVGGVGIVAAVALTTAVLLVSFGTRVFAGSGEGLVVVFAGGLAMHLIGLYDDVRQLHARWKFLAQIAVATLAFACGVRMTTLSLPFLGVVELGTVAGLLFTVLWFVGITNAFNLIDGLDGLASGAALFALTTMFVVAIANGRYGAALVTLTLAGTTLGFLYFNFHPATIFLGDSGSLFLGFMLAGIGVLSAQKSPTVVAVAIPVVSLGLPVLDTAIAVTRRFLRRQPIFAADRGHIHHRLLGRGHSPRTVVLALYAVCALLALGAMLLVNDGGPVALVLVTIGVGVGLMVQRLRIYEFEEVARLLRSGVRQRHTIERGVRVREASARLSRLDDLSAVFAALGETFAADGCPRAEVRLRASFLEGRRAAARPHPVDTRSGEDDEVAVWVWSSSGEAEVRPAWWQVTLPLLDEHGGRIGALVLWQEGVASASPFPHFHAIAGDLRGQVEAKLLSLWPVGAGPGVIPPVDAYPRPAAASAPDGARGLTRVASGSGPKIPAA